MPFARLWWRDRAERRRLDLVSELVDKHGLGVLPGLPDVLDAAPRDESDDTDRPPGQAAGGG